MDAVKPQVSVCLFSYNYESYISAAIDSVLEQKTDFGIEIVVGDDCSTDRTREIVLEYRNRYPDIIQLSFNEQNIGGTRNWIKTMNAASGKYIALLDGDDYFIDNRKLQKQFDLLENATDANISFSSVKEVYEHKNEIDQEVTFSQNEYFTGDMLKQGWFMRTSTLFFRNGILPANPPEWVYQFPYRYDTILIVLLSLHSRAINCKDVMTAWRRHDAGLSYVLTKNYLQHFQTEKKLYKYLDELTDHKFGAEIDTYMRKMRTDVVFNTLKSLKFSNFSKLGWQAILKINYAYLLKHFVNAISNKFGLR